MPLDNLVDNNRLWRGTKARVLDFFEPNLAKAIRSALDFRNQLGYLGFVQHPRGFVREHFEVVL